MRKISNAVVALLATVAFSTSAVAEQNPCGNPCAGKPKPKDTKAKVDVKADAKVQVGEGAGESGMPEKPTPPAELLAMAKVTKGTWTCKGDMTNATGTYKSKFTIKNKLDMGNMWIRSDMTEAKSKSAKYPFKFTAFTTFNSADSKWYRVMIDNWGGIGKGWSTGADAAGKVTWEMELSGPMGTSKFRDYEEPDATSKKKKKPVHMWGEMSMDGGKTWTKVYDTTCTKF